MKQQNKNFILNILYQLLTYVFPLLTVPYVSRVLGVDNIGIYSYTYSIVYLFMLVAMLGINNYGNREIARVRDDKQALSRTFTSIYSLQILLSSVALLIYAIYAIFICNSYPVITILQIVCLLSVYFDVNWFYFGLERFKMTITRNLIIKVFSLILIFVFVRKSDDLWKYTLIMAGANLVSQLYLFINLKRYVTAVKVTFSEVFSHFRSVLILFIPVLAFGIYRIMDKTMLGAFSSVTELGYYENAERLINIPISVINALGTVMLPYMAYMAKNSDNELKQIVSESMNTALVLATMMAAGLILISKDASTVIFGPGFEKSAGIIVVLSITIIASAWANVIRTQYLIPNRKDGVYVKSTLWGAVVNFISNIIFIRKMGAYGACIGTVVAEYFIMIYQSIATRKDLPQNRFFCQLVTAVTKAIFVVCVTYICTIAIHNIYLRLISRVLVAAIVFLFVNNKFVRDFLGVRGVSQRKCE